MKVLSMDRPFALADEDLAALMAFGKERCVTRGETLWVVGDEPDTLYLLCHGKANLVISSSESKDAIVQYCARGETFCLAAAIAGKAYPCSAVAATDLTVLAIPRSRFNDLFKRLPSFAKLMMSQMSEQICESHCKSAMNAEPVKERLADLLGRLNRDYEGRDLPFTRQELANMSGTTVESVIRTLSGWEKSGVIKTERGHIRVHRPKALEEAAA